MREHTTPASTQMNYPPVVSSRTENFLNTESGQKTVQKLMDLEWLNPTAFNLIVTSVSRHHAGTAAFIQGNWKGEER